MKGLEPQKQYRIEQVVATMSIKTNTRRWFQNHWKNALACPVATIWLINWSACTEEDLVKYANMRREIAGRISRIVTLDTLNASDFEAILESPASPIQKIEQSHHVKLTVDAPTRRKLAEEAEKSKMGCRYIRSKLQSMLDDQMFDRPESGEYELCCP